MLHYCSLRKAPAMVAIATATITLALVLVFAYSSRASFHPLHYLPRQRAHPPPSEKQTPLFTPASIVKSSNATNTTLSPALAYLKPPTDRTLQIALVNAHHAHDDVQTALYDAIAHTPNVNITRYQLQSRFGMEYVVSNLPLAPTVPWQNISEFSNVGIFNDMPVPDIVFSTTCGNDYDLSKQDDAVADLKPIYRRLLQDHNTYLFCVMHTSNHWIDSYGWGLKTAFAPWVKARRVSFITMSNHVGENFVHKVFSRWWWDAAGAAKPRSHTLVPVFPVALPKLGDPSLSAKGLRIAVEGEFHRGRDYAGALARLVELKKALYVKGRRADADDLQVHILGHGLAKPVVPPELKDQVVFHENLDYSAYYGLLSQMDVVLPAFSTTELGGVDYYVNKASSTIGTSLIAGVPIVATEKLLRSYTFLDSSTVWLAASDKGVLQKQPENMAAIEVEAALNLLDMTQEDRAAKKVDVRARTGKLLEQNYANVRQWIQVAHARVDFMESAAAKSGEFAGDSY